MLLEKTPTLPLIHRPRRNRRSFAIRSLVQETHLRPSDLVMPYFVMEGENKKVEISSMPGIFRMSLDHVMRDIEKIHAKGVQAVILFPVVPNEKKTR